MIIICNEVIAVEITIIGTFTMVNWRLSGFKYDANHCLHASQCLINVYTIFFVFSKIDFY